MSHFVALAGALTSVILGKGHEKSSANSGKRNASSPLTEYNSQTTCFAIGVVSGASLMLLALNQMSKRRIKERVKFFLKHMTEEDIKGSTDGKDDMNGDRCKQFSYGESSLAQILVDSTNALTSHMHCKRIVLKPSTAVAYRNSEAVEFYFIISGHALFTIRNGTENEDEICSYSKSFNEQILIQPFTLRSFSNTSPIMDLVLLQITDSPRGYDKKDSEIVVPSSEINPSNTLGDALHGFKSAYAQVTNIFAKKDYNEPLE